MTIQIEHIGQHTNEGQTYFTFTLSLAFAELGQIRLSGWRYYPSTGTLAAPARNSGTKNKPRYVTTQWLKGDLYNMVTDYAQWYFVSHKFCEEPYESPEARKAVFEGRQK